MSRATCQANSTFKLIVRLTDCNGILFDPDGGIDIDIFDPAADTADNTTATVLNATTASLGAVGQQGPNLIIHEGTGIYSYTFPIVANATIGTWTDRWSFTHLSVPTEASFTFTVSERVQIESGDLGINSKIRITLGSSLPSLSGSFLAAGQVVEFYTPLSPMYSTEELVLLEAGGHLNGVLSSTLELAIHKASLSADHLTFATTIKNASWYNFAREKVVTCMAARNILSNTASNMVKKKQLADLSVEYDLTYSNKINDLEMCVQEYLSVLQTGGVAGVGTSLKALSVTPGSMDPDYPDFGRSYTNQSSPRSGANTKTSQTDSRGNSFSRKSRTYRPRGKGSWNK
jgi:hypothetical protein